MTLARPWKHPPSADRLLQFGAHFVALLYDSVRIARLPSAMAQRRESHALSATRSQTRDARKFTIAIMPAY